MIHIFNSILWAIASILIVSSGLYFTHALHFIQFQFKEMFHNLFQNSDHKGITPIQSLMLSLASRIGVGSIAGVALAIYLGGIGSIFWMWVSAFLGAASTFAESVLGMIYREKDGENLYKGGPAYYIKKGLGKPKLGSLYAFLVLLSYIGGFVGIQANTITKSLNVLTPVDPFIVGIGICLITSIIIYGGVKVISKVTDKLVPIMTFFYLSIAFYILCKNITQIPNLLLLIIKSAFNFRSFTSGFLASLIVGMQRGIFSNEAGLGTGSITSSTSNTKIPARQGYIQMLGIYITTLLICTATAIIILTSNYQELILEDVNGIEITQYAFQYHLGNFGSIAVFISILLFSFSTILTGYYDGESCLKYFIHNISKKHLLLLKIISLVVLFTGAIASSNFLWNVVDILVAFLAIINIYALFHLKSEVKQELDYYKKRKYDKI